MRSRSGRDRYWSGSRAAAYVRVADIRPGVDSGTDSGRHAATRQSCSRYRHYLDELAKKPQAVRQAAPEVTAEFDAPSCACGSLLAFRYGELDAARVVAKLIGAIAVVHQGMIVALRVHPLLPRHVTADQAAPHQAHPPQVNG